MLDLFESGKYPNFVQRGQSRARNDRALAVIYFKRITERNLIRGSRRIMGVIVRQ
jgi:hypothetical protein